jgi:carbon storage regulator CsrA
VRGSQVRLGVDAPTDVRIFREEIYRATQEDPQRTTEPEPEIAKANGNRKPPVP